MIELPKADAPVLRAFRTIESGWRGNADDLADFLKPYIMRLEALVLEDKRASVEAYAYAAADFVVRVIAPQALDAAGMLEVAKTLRALPPVIDRATADSAVETIEAAMPTVGEAVSAVKVACANVCNQNKAKAKAKAAVVAAETAVVWTARNAELTVQNARWVAIESASILHFHRDDIFRYTNTVMHSAAFTLFVANKGGEAVLLYDEKGHQGLDCGILEIYRDLAGQLLGRLLDVMEAGTQNPPGSHPEGHTESAILPGSATST